MNAPEEASSPRNDTVERAYRCPECDHIGGYPERHAIDPEGRFWDCGACGAKLAASRLEIWMTAICFAFWFLTLPVTVYFCTALSMKLGLGEGTSGFVHLLGYILHVFIAITLTNVALASLPLRAASADPFRRAAMERHARVPLDTLWGRFSHCYDACYQCPQCKYFDPAHGMRRIENRIVCANCGAILRRSRLLRTIVGVLIVIFAFVFMFFGVTYGAIAATWIVDDVPALWTGGSSGLILGLVLAYCVPGLIAAAFHSCRPTLHLAPGHCSHCDYDLRGAKHERCPECGERVGGAVRRAMMRSLEAHTGPTPRDTMPGD